MPGSRLNTTLVVAFKFVNSGVNVLLASAARESTNAKGFSDYGQPGFSAEGRRVGLHRTSRAVSVPLNPVYPSEFLAARVAAVGQLLRGAKSSDRIRLFTDDELFDDLANGRMPFAIDAAQQWVDASRNLYINVSRLPVNSRFENPYECLIECAHKALSRKEHAVLSF